MSRYHRKDFLWHQVLQQEVKTGAMVSYHVFGSKRSENWGDSKTSRFWLASEMRILNLWQKEKEIYMRFWSQDTILGLSLASSAQRSYDIGEMVRYHVFG